MKIIIQDTQFAGVYVCTVGVPIGETFDEKAALDECRKQKGTDRLLDRWHTGPMDDGGTVYVNMLAARMP